MAPESICLIVRATTNDLMDLTEFDARFETTHYTTELLWEQAHPRTHVPGSNCTSPSVTRLTTSTDTS